MIIEVAINTDGQMQSVHGGTFSHYQNAELVAGESGRLYYKLIGGAVDNGLVEVKLDTTVWKSSQFDAE